MDKWIKISAYTIIGLFLVLSFFLFFQEKDTTIKIGYNKHLGYQTLFVALENNYFPENIEAIGFDSTNQMLSALASGRIDAVLGGSNVQAVFSLEDKAPGTIEIISTSAYEIGQGFTCVAVKKDSNIETYNDIEGKTIASLPGSFAKLWVGDALNEYNVENYYYKEIPPRLQISALESNQVDVLFTVEPLCSFIVNRDVGRVIDKDPLRYFSEIFALSIVSKKLSNQNKEIIKEANRKAINFINNNPHEALNIMAEYTGYDKEMIKGMNHLIYNEEIDATELQNIVNSLYLEGILDRQIPVRTLI